MNNIFSYFIDQKYPKTIVIMHPIDKNGIKGIFVFLSTFFSKYGKIIIKKAIQKLNKKEIMEKKYPYKEEKKAKKNISPNPIPSLEMIKIIRKTITTPKKPIIQFINKFKS